MTAIPPKKASISIGDRVLEINGIDHTEFESAKAANALFDSLIFDVVWPDDEDSDISDT